MHYIGIDPGMAGGLATLDINGDIVDAIKMPETPKDLVDWLRATHNPIPGGTKARAVLERVNAGVFGARKFGQRMGVVSAFTFGKGVGRLEGILAALEIPYDLVAPATWQAALQCKTGGDKNISKRRAQDLFPHFKITHAIADALLLAEYARRSSGWGIRPGRGVTKLPDPKESRDGKEKGGEEFRAPEVSEADRELLARRQQEREDIIRATGARGWQPVHGEELLTSKQRRDRASRAALSGASGDGAGPRHTPR